MPGETRSVFPVVDPGMRRLFRVRLGPQRFQRGGFEHVDDHIVAVVHKRVQLGRLDDYKIWSNQMCVGVFERLSRNDLAVREIEFDDVSRGVLKLREISVKKTVGTDVTAVESSQMRHGLAVAQVPNTAARFARQNEVVTVGRNLVHR